MKNPINILSVLSLGVWLMAVGQIQAQETDPPKPSRWEVGVDLLTLIDKNNFPAYSMFGRYNLTPNAARSTYLRMRIGFQYETFLDSAQLTHTAITHYNFSHSSYSPFLMVGLQRDIKTLMNTSFYYGADLYYQGSILKKEWGPNTRQIGDSMIKFENFGSNILFGFSQKIGTNFKISLESSINIYLRKFHLIDEIWFQDEEGIETGGKIGNNFSKKITTNILPFSQIIFSYNF